MPLSDRIRPDCEAAPWVIKEVKELEAKLAKAKKALKFYSLIDDETGTYDCNVAREALKEIE